MFIVKLLLAGPSGSGKTAVLEYLDSDAQLFGEQKRKPTPEEIKAWGSEVEVSTSGFINIGQFIVNYDSDMLQYKVDRGGKVKEGGFGVTLFDTCGQVGDLFRGYKEIGTFGTAGILFVLDASRDPDYYTLEITNAFNELHQFYKTTNIYGPVSQRNPMLPPIVILCNKQDLVQRRNIVGGGKGREVIYQSILRSYDLAFAKYKFVGTCATGYTKNVSGTVFEVVPPWGIEEAIDILFKEIIERREIAMQKPPQTIKPLQ